MRHKSTSVRIFKKKQQQQNKQSCDLAFCLLVNRFVLALFSEFFFQVEIFWKLYILLLRPYKTFSLIVLWHYTLCARLAQQTKNPTCVSFDLSSQTFCTTNRLGHYLLDNRPVLSTCTQPCAPTSIVASLINPHSAKSLLWLFFCFFLAIYLFGSYSTFLVTLSFWVYHCWLAACMFCCMETRLF